jgi:hypothetical protein
MADIRPGSGHEKGNFLQIKQDLDPGSSYIVFEQDIDSRQDHIFNPSQAVYGFLKNQGMSWQQVEDFDLSMAYLIVRVLPGHEEKVLGRLLGCGLPENIVFYIFKAKEV